jgi:hypothetical protein
LGLSNPEIKYFVDMFSKRKEKMGGDNISLLAIEIRKCYLYLIKECEMFQKKFKKQCGTIVLSATLLYFT